MNKQNAGRFYNCVGTVAFLVLIFLPSTKTHADSLWEHGGSTLRLEAHGNNRKFFYETVRPNLPITAGTLLFEGVRNRDTYTGKAYKFSKKCGPINYQVVGVVSSDERQITLIGSAPKRDDRCRVVEHVRDELVFQLQDDSNKSASTSRSSSPDTSVSASVSAEERDQALNLLKASFACPIKPRFIKEVHNGVMLFYSSTIFREKFLGDNSLYRVERAEHTIQKSKLGAFANDKNFDSGENFGERDIFYIEARFDALESARVEGGGHADPTAVYVALSCKGGQACFLYDPAKMNNERPHKHESGDTRFCDRATAENAVLAIKILIKASKQ